MRDEVLGIMFSYLGLQVWGKHMAFVIANELGVNLSSKRLPVIVKAGVLVAILNEI